MNYSKEGFEFEEKLLQCIKSHINDAIIYRENEVKNKYGSNITAIDLEVIYKNKYIFIQLKWRDNSSSIKDINHFLHCCNSIKKNNNFNDFLPLFVTKIPITKPSLKSLENENGFNIVFNDMDICCHLVIQKICNYFDIKVPEYFLTSLFQNNNELTKNEIIHTILNNNNDYNKSKLSKLTKTELIGILNNISPVEKKVLPVEKKVSPIKKIVNKKKTTFNNIMWSSSINTELNKNSFGYKDDLEKAVIVNIDIENLANYRPFQTIIYCINGWNNFDKNEFIIKLKQNLIMMISDKKEIIDELFNSNLIIDPQLNSLGYISNCNIRKL